MQLVILSIRH